MENEKVSGIGNSDFFWENLGIKFTVPSEQDFDEILEFYKREFVPGIFFLSDPTKKASP